MKGRIVSIDYGLKRLGLAISDETKTIASSLGTLLAGKNSAETISFILKKLEPYTIEKIIIGNPIHMNGKVGFLADEVAHFLTLLQQAVSCPVILWDERLSTVQAERALMQGGMNRKKRSQLVDSVAAIIILQSFLGF